MQLSTPMERNPVRKKAKSTKRNGFNVVKIFVSQMGTGKVSFVEENVEQIQ